MPDRAIAIEDLGKRYVIGRAAYPSTFRDALAGKFRRVGSALGRLSRFQAPVSRGSGEEFWALRNISFEVKKGEVVGIIGRNGAGKSTLLKILSRITEPTAGRIKIRGRVASLLEVGTGFHPDLTGRENLFLNGAILGMSRAEIRRKFDEIVAFAEVEKFLDTQVKYYSSGMYVRLAFAVAAHLEPEILIVDEVLAVGDLSFQRKCLGKMRSVSAEEGRTVLFVSHNLPAVGQLCSRAVWLHRGRLRGDGTAREICSEYLSSDTADQGEMLWREGIANRGVTDFLMLSMHMLNPRGQTAAIFEALDGFAVELRFRVLRPFPFCRVGFLVTTLERTVVFDAYDCDEPAASGPRGVGDYVLRCRVPGGLLLPGNYLIYPNADVPNLVNLFTAERMLTVTLEGSGVNYGHGAVRREGLIRPQLAWTCEKTA